jgi:thiamine-phosphate pyrophosphorylase
MHPKLPCAGLYAITDGPRSDLLSAVEAALRGGAALLQYRDKTGDSARRHAEALDLRRLCERYRVPLIVNDDVELAAAIGAAGVHLGEEDAGIAEARARLGAGAIVGVSCYDSFARAREAAAAGADYLAFGAFFPTATKPNARRAAPELLRAAQETGLPRVAIGGITPDNARPLLEAGADFLAVVSGVFGRPDVFQATRSYASLFENENGMIGAQTTQDA